MTRVLVIEDDATLARALAITLRTKHYDVTIAHTGAVGLDAVASWHPDLVVLDLGLPDLDGMDELLARLRAAARLRPTDEGPPVVVTATFTIDSLHRRVTRDGAEVRLTPTEWNMLEILARNLGKVVGRRELLHELRGPHPGRETHYLRVYVAQLRRKLEVDPAHPRHLLTEPGVGYRLEP